MRATRLKSSMMASAAGGVLVLTAFATGSSTLGTKTAEKGDLSMPVDKVACVNACADPRIDAAFETVAEHYPSEGTTVLVRTKAVAN